MVSLMQKDPRTSQSASKSKNTVPAANFPIGFLIMKVSFMFLLLIDDQSG